MMVPQACFHIDFVHPFVVLTDRSCLGMTKTVQVLNMQLFLLEIIYRYPATLFLRPLPKGAAFTWPIEVVLDTLQKVWSRSGPCKRF